MNRDVRGATVADLHRVLVHMLDELNGHAGYADVVRELVEGSVGAGQ